MVYNNTMVQKYFAYGFFYSVLCMLFTFAVTYLTPLVFLQMMGVTFFHGLQLVIFLVLNTIIWVCFRAQLDVRRGLIRGYLCSVVFIIIIISSIGYDRQESQIDQQKYIDSGHKYREAIEANDVSLCVLDVDPSYCYYNYATSKDDIEVCSKIGEENKGTFLSKEKCIEIINNHIDCKTGKKFAQYCFD